MNNPFGVILKLWLIVWGILAFIALGVPGVVAGGMFFIVPGLILIAAPTIFLYSAMFAVLRYLLPTRPGLPGLTLNAIAAVLPLMLGWVVAQPVAIVERRAFARANLPEVLPASPVKLAGNIRLELPKNSFSVKDTPENCRALCAALLDTPGVETVTLAETGQPVQAASLVFRLIPRGSDRSRGAYPVEPEEILDDLPPGEAKPWNPREDETRRAARRKDGQAVAAGWGLRLSSSQKLVAERARIEADQTIRITEDRPPGKRISISRVEILQNGGAQMRRSIVIGRALTAPLVFAGVGGVQDFHVELSRQRLISGPDYPGLKPVTELFRYSSLAQPKVDSNLMTAMLDRLRSATGNPALTREDPDFGLADLWLPTIDWQHLIPPDQLSVLGRVISDERIPVPQKLYDGYEFKVAPELRSALGSRILAASTPSQARTQLARLLSRMPEGTFATPSADELAILSSSDLRYDAYPMIVRLADQGEAAVPELLSILINDKSLKPAFRRGRILHAVALGFATLGLKAHSALPQVDALFSTERREIAGSWGDTWIWYLAMARMGKPIDEFNWFNEKPEAAAKDRENLRRQVERFDPKEVWNY